jgi:hypothetical protein
MSNTAMRSYYGVGTPIAQIAVPPAISEISDF